jgi:hypothetical protein
VRRALLGLLGAALLAGCSLAPSDAVLHELATSERSWCFMGTSIYANIRISGTGLKQGRVSCTMEGMTVNSTPIPPE